MRIGFVVAVLLLLGAQTGPASAGVLMSLPMGMLMPCSQAASTTLPRDLCRDLAEVMLGPASGLGLSVIEPIRREAWTVSASGLQMGALLPPIPVQQAGWRHHMDHVVAGYDDAFGGDGAVVLPAVPAALWPGGNPFARHATD